MKNSSLVIFAVLAVCGMTVTNNTSASARGAAPNIMNSPGYQRALEESRKRQAEPYLQKPPVYPRKIWRKRGKHH
jgi:nitrate reductase cytochrome c-type subunit